MEQKDTVGKISSELLNKSDDRHSVVEQMQENLTDFDRNVFDCVNLGRSKYPGDFYVVVLTKTERLMKNVIRNYFFNRFSCPTPDNDQIVYHYNRKADQITFLWVIPDKETCAYLLNNALFVSGFERELLNFVIQFNSNTLLQWSKRLNKEKHDSNILEK